MYAVASGQLELPDLDEAEVDLVDIDHEGDYELQELGVELPVDLEASEPVDGSEKEANPPDVPTAGHDHTDSDKLDTQGWTMGVSESILNSRRTKKRKRVPGAPQSLRFLIGRRAHTLKELEGGALGLLHLKGLWTGNSERRDSEEGGLGEAEVSAGVEVAQEGSSVGLKGIVHPQNFALARRYATPETEDLLRFVRGEFKNVTPLYENTISSVLGGSIESIQKQVKAMEMVGFSRSEVSDLLPYFPPIFSVDMNNVYKVCTALKELQMSWRMIRGILKHQTHVFLQDVDEVSDAINFCYTMDNIVVSLVVLHIYHRYRRTGFNCECLIIASCEFFGTLLLQCTQKCWNAVILLRN